MLGPCWQGNIYSYLFIFDDTCRVSLDWETHHGFGVPCLDTEVLGVSCAAGYQGAELGNSLPVSSELLTCVDGTWLDSKGRRTPWSG